MENAAVIKILRNHERSGLMKDGELRRVALNATGTKIGGAVLLRNNFRAEGEAWLFGATVGGDLTIGGDPKVGGADLATGAGAKLSVRGSDIKGALNIVGMRAGANTMVDLSNTS